MDFHLGSDQRALVELAARIFTDLAPPDRVAEVEAEPDRFDRRLWGALADAGLLGLAIDARFGGSGLTLLETALVLEQQGRRVAPVPLWPTVVLGAAAIAEFGTDDQRQLWLPDVVAGRTVLTAALHGVEPQRSRSPLRAAPAGTGFTVTGELASVSAAHLADRVVVPVYAPHRGWYLVLVDPASRGCTRRRAVTTNRQVQEQLSLHDVYVPAEDLVALAAADVARLVAMATAGLCALQVGVIDEALTLTAAHVSHRRQFGREIGTFQAVAMRAADAHIDLQVTRLAMLHAAWSLSVGRPAVNETAAAKWWAGEAGHRCLHTALHLHGGIGNDVDYPLHRYFLWARQIGLTLGGPESQLDRLAANVLELR